MPREPDVGDYKKLENQPLIFVLAEFRFSPVMQIANYIPETQEAFRKKYPILEKRTEQKLQIQSGSIQVSSMDQWAFISPNRKSAVVVNQERLVYVTAEYPRFEGFLNSCGQAIETLVEIVDPDLVLRIGLRYSDLVIVDEGENVTDLVNEHFALPECIQSIGRAGQYSTNTSFDTDTGRLMIRSLYGEHDLTCLPDAQGLAISIDSDSTRGERMILDFDHYWEVGDETVDFDTKVVLDKLTRLHDTSRAAFWNITTDNARNKKWA